MSNCKKHNKPYRIVPADNGKSFEVCRDCEHEIAESVGKNLCPSGAKWPPSAPKDAAPAPTHEQHIGPWAKRIHALFRDFRGEANVPASRVEDELREFLKAAAQPSPGSDWPECEDFYNLMQAYRHTPIERMEDVKDAYESVKKWLRDHVRDVTAMMAEDGKSQDSASPQPAAATTNTNWLGKVMEEASARAERAKRAFLDEYRRYAEEEPNGRNT